MSFQEATDNHQRRRRRLAYIQTGEYAVSGSDARIAHGSNAEYVIIGHWVGGGSTSVGHSMTVYTVTGAAAPVTAEYDPAFVAEILAADAAPPEAAFNNVVDMLEWLNRD